MSYEAWGDGDEFYGPELPEGWLNEDDAKELQDRIAELEQERAEALLDAERTREERNREHVRLNAEWMAKCEELRAALNVALEAMESDWFKIDGEWGPIMDEFGDLEGAIVSGKADHIKQARDALAKKEGA